MCMSIYLCFCMPGIKLQTPSRVYVVKRDFNRVGLGLMCSRMKKLFLLYTCVKYMKPNIIFSMEYLSYRTSL
jgi:hypothetical protein